MTYDDWFDERVKNGAVFYQLNFRDYGAIVTRAVQRGEIDEEYPGQKEQEALKKEGDE